MSKAPRPFLWERGGEAGVRGTSIHVRHYDIAIMGAGPAGSTAAILLARRGYDVVLVDRARFPRDKVCGDYLTPGAVKFLRDEIGVEGQLLRAGAVRVERQTVVTHGNRSFAGHVDAIACPRRVTDAVLVDEARRSGVDVIEGFHVRDILFDGHRVTGFSGKVDSPGAMPTALGRHVLSDRLDVRARITIGADGTHSLLARRLGLVRPIPRLHRLVLSGYIDDTGNDMTMYLPVNRTDACCGLGPSDSTGKRNLTIVVPTSEATAIAAGREHYFRDRLSTSFPHVPVAHFAWPPRTSIRNPIIGEGSLSDQGRQRLRSTACFGHRTKRAAADGALLIGDAATFIHPFTGEGVYYALEGARLAAAAVDEALQVGDVSYRTLSAYDRARAKSLSPRYRLCDIVQHIVHSPRLLKVAAEILQKSPPLSNQIFSTVGDITEPASLVSLANIASYLRPAPAVY